MKKNMIEIQKKARDNSRDVDNFLRDLNAWTAEMKDDENNSNCTEKIVKSGDKLIDDTKKKAGNTAATSPNKKVQKSSPSPAAENKLVPLQELPCFDIEFWERSGQRASPSKAESVFPEKQEFNIIRELPCFDIEEWRLSAGRNPIKSS